MRLLFNVTDAISDAPDHGITRTERRLAIELAERDDVEFVVVRAGVLYGVDRETVRRRARARHDGSTPSTAPTVERFGVDAPPDVDGLHIVERARRRRRRASSEPVALRPVDTTGDDVLVSAGLDWIHGTVTAAEQLVFGFGGRFVGFCYDLIPIDHPEWLFPPDPDGFRTYLRRLVRVADRIVCISEHTQRDLLRHAPELGADRAPVLRLGADAAVDCDPHHEAFAASLFDGEPYLVYCATLDRRKNHQLLYRVAKELARRGQPANMVFVGRVGSGVDDLIDCLRHDPSIAGRIAHVTNCDDAHLAAIYRRAELAVYPSLYEGWGLGVTEALAHGKRCLIATGSSLVEAGLGVCESLPPLRTEPWADKIEAYLTHPEAPVTVDIPTWADSTADLVGLVAT